VRCIILQNPDDDGLVSLVVERRIRYVDVVGSTLIVPRVQAFHSFVIDKLAPVEDPRLRFGTQLPTYDALQMSVNLTLMLS
jgi:hypothetical protein